MGLVLTRRDALVFGVGAVATCLFARVSGAALAAGDKKVIRIHTSGGESPVFGSADYMSGGDHMTDDGQRAYCIWNPLPAKKGWQDYEYTEGSYLRGGRAYAGYHFMEDGPFLEYYYDHGFTFEDARYVCSKLIQFGDGSDFGDGYLFARRFNDDSGYDRTWAEVKAFTDASNFMGAPGSHSRAAWDIAGPWWNEIRNWRASSANNANAPENNYFVVAYPVGRYGQTGYSNDQGTYLQVMMAPTKSRNGFLQVRKDLNV